MKRIIVAFGILFAFVVQTVGLELPLQAEKLSASSGVAIKNDASEALVVNFPAYDQELKNNWPTVTVPLPKDCSKYDFLEVDLALTGGFINSISFNFRDLEGGKYFETHSIVDANRVKIRIGLHPQRLSLSKMGQLRIYHSRPPFSSQFTIYQISLINSLPEKLSQLVAAFRKLDSIENIREVEKLIEECHNGAIALADASGRYDKLVVKLRHLQMEHLRRLNRQRFKHDGFALGVTDSLEKVHPFDFSFSAELPAAATLELARNEAEALPLITIAPADKKLENISVSAGDFICAGKPQVKLPAPVAAPIGLVEIKNSRVAESRPGYYPDPVLEFTSTVSELASNQIQSWLIRFKTEKDTVPGIYHGTVILSTKEHQTILPVEIKVYDFALPERMSLKTATSVYGSKLLDKHKAAMEEYILKNYHLNGFSIYSDSGGYGEPVLPSIESYRRAMAHGLNFLPIVYLKLPRQAMHTGSGLAPGESKAAWEKLSPEQQSRYPENWKKKYIEILEKRIPELKAAGLYQFSYCYGFDEATSSEWPAIADLLAELKSRFPDLKIISTACDPSYGVRSILGSHLDGWIPPVRTYNFEAAREARKRGGKVWYYTTQMTIDGTPLVDIRSELGERAFANEVDGWLVWTVSRWYSNREPITAAPYTNWNPESFPGDNGGGSYFCMGPDGKILPTLRAEAIRDGIEDYEYFTILKNIAFKRLAGDLLRQQAENLLNNLSRHQGTDIAALRLHRAQAATLIEQFNQEK